MCFRNLTSTMAAERAQLRDMQHTIQQLTQALLQAARANNNNNNNRAAGDLHRNFRNLNPPRFSGTTDPDEAENWLKETEQMVRRAQCLEDATELTEHIKGRMFRKEQTSGALSKPTNGKKRPLSITDGPSQERKPKIPTTIAPNNKPRCKHCDKLGHTTDECWRKAVTMCQIDPPRKKTKNLFSGLGPPPEVATARYAVISEVATPESDAL
ncbi:hypothetical protein Taro_004415 [Colocasia esculenta]|uniref:CCHC-type domain-containing protein n=1 Tax=Colocasia esculenta TaxID=4460 RepID=A0A843TI37_COLES|nr:hypothetical protein [Colocasia esculenta]